MRRRSLNLYAISMKSAQNQAISSGSVAELFVMRSATKCDCNGYEMDRLVTGS
ncbi:hypothetical protein RTCIAT899_PC06095 (plasmid) [Rhizobium tropici CIAT 899]|nr:hypothetical protein RTCIAT899_PC06095 [Rhizobium tropici CIAT 899]